VLERQLSGGLRIVVTVRAKAAEYLDVFRQCLLRRRLAAAGQQRESECGACGTKAARGFPITTSH
jgi:hypothetical protein